MFLSIFSVWALWQNYHKILKNMINIALKSFVRAVKYRTIMLQFHEKWKMSLEYTVAERIFSYI